MKTFFAGTRPGHNVEVGGAATARLSCRARRVSDGWRLSGRKCFISDGAVARWITLFAAQEGKGVDSWSCHQNRLRNRPLVSYQDVQLALADMMIQLSAMRSTVWQAVRHRFPLQAAGSIAKVFCSDTAWGVCNAAMELLGDHGYSHAQGVEKAARDARLTQIYEGTNQINRLAVVESQVGAEFQLGAM